jgi:hypothetical protein
MIHQKQGGKIMGIRKLSLLLVSAITAVALLNGCGSSAKEGSVSDVASVASEGICKVCHAASLDAQTGTSIVVDYATSGHNPLNGEHSSGCQGCHGGGSQHNGVGPIPYPNPLASGRCATCHTGDYAVNTNLFTLAAESYRDNCSRCHNKNKAMTGDTLLNEGSLHGIA